MTLFFCKIRTKKYVCVCRYDKNHILSIWSNWLDVMFSESVLVYVCYVCYKGTMFISVLSICQ